MPRPKKILGQNAYMPISFVGSIQLGTNNIGLVLSLILGPVELWFTYLND